LLLTIFGVLASIGLGVLKFTQKQKADPDAPKFSESDSDLRRDGRMKFVMVNGRMQTRLYDKDGNEISPPPVSPAPGK
jgi:hypothetical protein